MIKQEEGGEEEEKKELTRMTEGEREGGRNLEC